MLNIAVVYHSGYGHTAKVAEAVAAGAQQGTAHVDLINVDKINDADWAVLDAADAIIMGAPTYMGGVSAQFKTFIDATSAKWFTHAWKDKIAAGFTNSGSYSGDKLGALQQLMILAMQHGMIWVGQAEMPPQKKGAEGAGPDDINRIGSFSGLMTQANNDDPNVTPPKGDLDTAKLFGKRVAEITARFKK